MRILLAEDDPTTRDFLCQLLRDEGHEVIATETGRQALDIIQGPNPPGIVILDWQMPELDGLQVVQRIKPLRIRLPLHLMILTGKDAIEDVVEALDTGADDYMVKPVRPPELLARLRVGQRHLELQQDFVTAVETLQMQALQDELTGLLNRRAYFLRLESEIQRAMRQHTGIAIIMADLDHFKNVNDTYGHLAGDAVLMETALRLGHSMRAFDIVGRYGGEEFSICLPLAVGAEVRAICERIRLAIAEKPFVTEAGEIRLTMSLGCVIIEKMDEHPDIQSILDRADAALYTAKRAGRNRCIIRNLRQSEDTVVSVDS